jgi:hypothetical protein
MPKLPTMDSAEKRREIDFRSGPPVKAEPPKEFKAKAKARSKQTLFAAGIFIVFTALLYSGLLPGILPGWIQKGIAILHASSAAWLGFSIMRDLRRRPLPTSTNRDPKSPNSAAAKAAREQKEHLLNSVGHQAPVQPRRKRRWGNLVAAGTFCAVLGLWFTSLAPIAAAETEFDFAGQLNEASTNTTLILTEPSVAVARPPRPMLQTILAARRIPLSRDDYQAGLQLIVQMQYDEARNRLEKAKQGPTIEPETLQKLDLALAQSYLFEGKYGEAHKMLKALYNQHKSNLVLAQMGVAALHANQYRDARQAAQQLADTSKDPVDQLRAMNLLLAIDLLQWRPERAKHESEARTLLKNGADLHAASLQNNLGVLKTFSAPPQYTAAQGNLNAALDLWNSLDQSSLPPDQHDPIAASALQNLAICDWWAGDYGKALKQVAAAQQKRSSGRVNNQGPALPADQAVHSRGLLASALCENTLGRWQLSRNTLNEALANFRTYPRTDPHRWACTLLEARINIGLLRYDEAISRCNELLKDTSLYSAQHPLLISAKLRQAEALLAKRNSAEARIPLNDVLAQLTSLRWHEDHPDLLTYYRLLAQLETGEKNFPAAKTALDQGETIRKRILAVQGATNQYRVHPEAAALLAARAEWAFAQAGKDNPQAPALLNAALADWTAAEKEMTQSIGEQDALSHPLNGRYVVMQGYMLYRLGKYAEAEARLRFWETEFLETMPPNHLWTAQTLDVLVMILKAQNKDCKSEETQAKELRKAIASGT